MNNHNDDMSETRPLSLDRKLNYWKELIRNSQPDDDRLLRGILEEVRSAFRDAVDTLEVMQKSDAMLIGKKLESGRKNRLQ